MEARASPFHQEFVEVEEDVGDGGERSELVGGEYGVYDNKGEKLVEAIAPLMNRLVIFDTHDFSYHGLPNPINFPEGKARRSVILYYYTMAPRPTSQIEIEKPHSALWKKRNFTDKKGNKTRDFK
mgnify:CR=1 FL=1